jgi:hypothetical protein
MRKVSLWVRTIFIYYFEVLFWLHVVLRFMALSACGPSRSESRPDLALHPDTPNFTKDHSRKVIINKADFWDACK